CVIKIGKIGGFKDNENKFTEKPIALVVVSEALEEDRTYDSFSYNISFGTIWTFCDRSTA
ncbi:MAG: hypothetical protein ACMG55_01965, partial [Microcoleus sp.]